MAAYLVVVAARVPELGTNHPLIAAARALHLPLDGVTEERRYLLAGDLTPETVTDLAGRLLVDPVVADVHAFSLDDGRLPTDGSRDADWAVDVAYLAGVTDNEGESVRVGAAHSGVGGVTAARTVRRTLLRGALDREDARKLAASALANDLVEAVVVLRPDETSQAIDFYRRLLALPAESPPTIQQVPVRDLDDPALEALSRQGILSLDLDEMRAIRDYFRRLDREPTDGELETLAQTWSEHCSHKTFKAFIRYRQEPEAAPDGHAALAELSRGAAYVDGMLQTYLMAATEQARKPWLLSAFVDNAGIVALGEDALSFKVETHNHPSALEPFGGANTGVGGVVRDVLGVAAQPIANVDVLCFGPVDQPVDTLPASVLHPARVEAGVVAGVRDYGNKLGVPTVAGAVLYDPGYTYNPLVFCGTVGLAPRDTPRGHAQPGDVVVVVGGRTGRDGIHGATFSSVELTHQTAETVGAAVQIGDPITEKQMIDVVLAAAERGLFRAITDCGAGGLSSAVGEMGERTGVAVELADVRIKYAGLQPWEIWVSEAQERMVLAVPANSLEAFLALCGGEDVEATPIGHFTEDDRLSVTYRGAALVDLDMQFLHGGRPRREMEATWSPGPEETDALPSADPLATLRALLGHPNIRSREPITRTYDHLVQGRTIQGPLGGIVGDAPTDAAVLQPRCGQDRAIAVGCGINPRYGLIDPYWMALAACDEALRNVVTAGGDPDGCSLLDNFCWGDPREPDRLGGLLRAAAGCHDAAVAWGIPFISGKDSLNNEYRDAEGRRVPIPGTLLISALAFVPSLAAVTSSDLKAAGDRLYLLGLTRRELGGSHRLLLEGRLGTGVPRVDLAAAGRIFRGLHRAMAQGLVRACHDLSEGGLGVAAAEMTFGGMLGLDLRLADVVRDSNELDDDVLLWSESPTRFLVEVAPDDVPAFEALLVDLPLAVIGEVSAEARLHIAGAAGDPLIDAAVTELKDIWRGDS